MSTANVAIEELISATTITLNGRPYPVKPIDGFGYQLMQNMDEKDSLMVMYRVAARCLAPNMSGDEVFGTETTQGLSAEQVGEVIAKARARIEKVEALASPNSEPASGKAKRSSGSRQPTR